MDRIIFGAPATNFFIGVYIESNSKIHFGFNQFSSILFQPHWDLNLSHFLLLSVLCSQQKHCEVSLGVGHVAQRQISCLPCSEAENILSFLFFMKHKFRSSSCIGFSHREEEREKSSRDKWCNNEKLKVSLVQGMAPFNWAMIKALLLSLLGGVVVPAFGVIFKKWQQLMTHSFFISSRTPVFLFSLKTYNFHSSGLVIRRDCEPSLSAGPHNSSFGVFSNYSN